MVNCSLLSEAFIFIYFPMGLFSMKQRWTLTSVFVVSVMDWRSDL